MKLRKIKSCWQLYMKKQDLSTSISETSENVYLLVPLSQLVSFEVCIYI